MPDPLPNPRRRADLLRRRASAAPIWIPVDGSSMGATISAGGRVLVDAAHAVPRRGEIWAFEDGGRIVVHRFRAHDGGRFWLRGDDNSRDDRPVPRSALIGRVIEIDDDGGRREVGDVARWIGRMRLDLDSVRRRITLRRPLR